MQKRYIIFGLSVVLALALAVPALGGPTNPIATVSAGVKSIANKALKKAKKAQKTANKALATANSAQSSANSAQSTANSANSAASAAKKAADGAQASADAADTHAGEAKSAAATADTHAGEAKSAAATADTHAGEAKSAAATADTHAGEAKAAAAAAEAKAKTKIGPPELVNGTPTESNSSSPKLALAECTGSKHATGGGFVTTGAQSDITPVISEQYGNGWLIDFVEIGGGTASNWSITAEVSCGATG